MGIQVLDKRWRQRILLAVFAGIAGCAPSYEKTGERALPSAGAVQLAVVQVYQNLPFHYVGLSHTVICRSAGTSSAPGDSRQGIPPGWSLVGYLANLDRGDQSVEGQRLAMDRAERLARENLVHGEGWLVWKTTFFLAATFDGCATWSYFRPEEVLPIDHIDTSAMKHCEPAHCARLAFELGKPLQVSDLRVEPPREGRPGRIAFTARSAAIKGSGERRVESADGGKSWSVISPR